MMHKCDVPGCDQRELVQGMCFDHCVVCPKCNENPCNGKVQEPTCNVCIMAYRPDDKMGGGNEVSDTM